MADGRRKRDLSSIDPFFEQSKRRRPIEVSRYAAERAEIRKHDVAQRLTRPPLTLRTLNRLRHSHRRSVCNPKVSNLQAKASIHFFSPVMSS